MNPPDTPKQDPPEATPPLNLGEPEDTGLDQINSKSAPAYDPALELGGPKHIGLDSISSKPAPEYNPAPARELVRGLIAGTLVGILAFIVVGILVIAWWGIGGQNNLDLLQTVATTLLTPVIGLVGAATGFYYGEKSTQAGNPPRNQSSR